ncbi:cupin domain-containing protein [Bacteroidota bacterium]
MKAEELIKILDLKEHPEGGYYKETFRSTEKLDKIFLPQRYGESRNFYSSIYYLLEKNQLSKFHRLKSDEIWAFHSGLPLYLHCINADSNQYELYQLGTDLEAGEIFQMMIPRNTWFCAEPVGDDFDYTLVSCIVSPGFDFSDFELGKNKN